MRYILSIATFLVYLLSSSFSQSTSTQSGQPGHSVPQQTGDTVSGTKYYLKILPADPTNPDRMPLLPQTDFTAVDVQPVPLTQVYPKYPQIAGPKKVEGTVWIKCLISTSGTVSKVEIMKSDNAIFDSVAVDAASKWTFKPASVNGKPVEAWAAIPFRFKLTK